MFIKNLNLLLDKAGKIFAGTYNEKNFLSFFRISISFIALFDLLSLRGDFYLLFSSSQTVIPQELIYIPSEYFSRFKVIFDFLGKHGLQSTYYSVIPVLYFTALVFLLVGMFSRVSALIALLCQLLIFKCFAPFNYGYDQFLSMSLFYCFIFPVGRYYSLDSKFFPNHKPTSFNYLRVIQIHLCIVYFFSGVAKMVDVNWWNGNSIWKALASVYNELYKIYPIILTVTGIGVVLLEIFYFIMVYFKKTRRIALTLAILMHLGIGILMQLYSFAAIMIVWNISAFGKFTNNGTPNENNV